MTVGNFLLWPFAVAAMLYIWTKGSIFVVFRATREAKAANNPNRSKFSKSLDELFSCSLCMAVQITLWSFLIMNLAKAALPVFWGELVVNLIIGVPITALIAYIYYSAVCWAMQEKP